MIWLLLILVIVFGLLLWLPIRVEIDTQQQIYKASWQGIFSVWVVPKEEGWRWFFRLFFWQKEWKPGKKAQRTEMPKEKKKPPAKKRKMPFSVRQGRALFRNLLRAIRVKHLRVNWDTGDFVLNAWLYPAFLMASRGRRQLFINFSGEQELAILLQTRLGLLAAAVLRVFLSSKK